MWHAVDPFVRVRAAVRASWQEVMNSGVCEVVRRARGVQYVARARTTSGRGRPALHLHLHATTLVRLDWPADIYRQDPSIPARLPFAYHKDHPRWPAGYIIIII